MANTNIVLPFLSTLAKAIPFVDPKTGMLSPDALRWIIELEQKIFGVWTDVPFDAADFTTNNAGVTWNVLIGNVNQLEYFQAGTFAVVVFNILNTTITGGDVDTLRITIPSLRQRANSALKVFNNPCVINVALPLVLETGVCGVANGGGGSAQLMITRAGGVNFTAAMVLINVSGILVFECQSVVVP